MEKSLVTQVENSGLKKNHLAKVLGIKPNHFYQCLSGNRQLSIKKQDTLKQFLAAIPAA